MRVLDDALHGEASPVKITRVRRHPNRYPSSQRPDRDHEPECGEPLPKDELVNRSLRETTQQFNVHPELIKAYMCLV